MDHYIIGIVLFFASILILISVALLARAGVKLDREKLMLVSNLNSIRNRSFFGVVLVILFISYLGGKFQWINSSVSFYAIISVLVAYLVWSLVFTLGKLKKNDFSKSYIRTYLTCLIIRVIGGALLFSLAYPY
jgi:hypothetical protein